MKCLKLNPNTDFDLLCSLVSPHKMGQKIMQKKSKLHFIFIENLSAPAANILKQDALRVGAELVTHKEVITGRVGASSALLIANEEQMIKLAIKEKQQDFGLKILAKFLQKTFTKPQKVRLMAVMNVNDDSFNPQSRVNPQNAQQKLEELLSLEPDFIDVGAVSSRPGSLYCGREEEFARLKRVLDLIDAKNYHQKSIFSLDSFDAYCVEYALNKGFKFINDITGLQDVALAGLARRYGAGYCLMHMQNSPHDMQDNPHYDNVLLELEDFFAQRLELLEGVEVVLDVGIGFGKRAAHNMLLIKHLEHFLHFERPLLVGASRKSFIDAHFKSAVEERLAGSLYLHLRAHENGASIIRTHDLKEHKQLFALHQAYEGVIL